MSATWNMPGLARATSGFDFLVGTWAVRSRRLREPLAAVEEWYVTDAAARATTLQNGAISVDEMWFPEEGFAGSSIRLYDAAEDAWTIYWVNSRSGRLQAPVVGRWSDSTFTADGSDVYNSVSIIARYRWHSISGNTATWEQAFSTDGRLTWQTNWVMEWRRDKNAT